MARVYKSDEQTWEEAVRLITCRDESWLKYWEDYHKWCRMTFRLYMSKNEWTSMGKRARLNLSLPFTIIETVAAETYRALFDEVPYWKQKPVGPEDDEPAKIVTEYVGNQTEKNKMRIQGYIFEKNRLMFGLSFGLVPWTYLKDWKRREVPVMEPIMLLNENGEQVPQLNPFNGEPLMKPSADLFGKPILKKDFQKEVTFDCWEFEPLFPWHVRSDPAISNPLKLMNSGEGVIVDRYYSDHQLKQFEREKKYKNVSRYLQSLEDESYEKERNNFDVKREDEETSRDLNAGFSYKRNLHHIRQYWGKAPIVTQTRKSGETVIWDNSAEPVEALIDICEKECFRIIRNPIDEQLRPVVAAQCHPVADNLISPGLIQSVESELREILAFRNARMDNLNQAMNPMHNVRSGVNVPVRDLMYRPNGVRRTPNPETDIVPVTPPALGMTLDKDLSQLEYNVQNATNALSAAQGASNVGQAFGNTARGIDFFQSRMQSRLQVIVNVAEDQFFGPLSDIVNSYNQQFLIDAKDFAVIGKENVYLTIKPDYLNRRDLIPVSAGKKLNRGKMLQIYDRMITEAGTLKDFIKVDYLIREMIAATDAFPNPDKLLYSEEEMQKMQAEKPDELKKNMSLSVAWKDLEPQVKQAVLSVIFPHIAQQLQQMPLTPPQPSPEEMQAMGMVA